MRAFLARVWARIGGQRAHRRVDTIIGSFEAHVRALEASSEQMSAEILHNASLQAELESRNMALRAQKARAAKVQGKIQDLVS